MTEPVFPAVPQPPMRTGHGLTGDVQQAGEMVGAIIDNRTGLPDQYVREVVRDQWVEVAGLQYQQPSSFSMYANNQGSMLARTPFRTPGSVIDEIRLARAVADTDDDVGAVIGEMNAIAFGEGVQNQHRDEKTLEFFNAMTGPTALDLEAVLEEMYRELLIASSVTTLTVFSRKRLAYWPLKSDQPVQAQLQVPNVGILPAENVRVTTNDILRAGELAYYVEDDNLRRWLDEFLSPRTSGYRQAIMRMEEPVTAALFTGRVVIPYTDGDPASRGQTLYTLNQRMVHRTTLPKGAQPYPRPLLTRDFALLEAKRLLNIMDYALLQGGTNYIVVAKKGSDLLPAQQGEVDNLMEQVRHASRSGVMVGDHRLSIEVITPQLTELLNPAKRMLIGRKLKMGLMRQTEEVPRDTGTQGAVNEMELTSRVVSADRRKLTRHAQATFYDECATRNRAAFPMGAPSIWAPKIVLSDVSLFWQNLLNARDRGDIPRRWVVEALGYDYDAALAERERELARGDDDVLMPAAVPFSDSAGPQDNNQGRPQGTSSNNGTQRDSPSRNRRDAHAPRRVVQRNAGETVVAMVEDGEVTYIGEVTRAVLEDSGEVADFNGYVTQAERECIEWNQLLRSGPAVIVPVNPAARCTELACVKLGANLRMIVGQRLGDGALVAKALRFTEPAYNLQQASEYALRWGFVVEPFVESAARRRHHESGGGGGYALASCTFCGTQMPDHPSNPVCPSCNTDHSAGGGSSGPGGEVATLLAAMGRRLDEIAERVPAPPPTG